MKNIGAINSVSDFLNKTEGVHHHSKEERRFFCRGQGSIRLKLRPKIGRYAYAFPEVPSGEPIWKKNFTSMFSQFEREYITHHSTVLSRRIDKLSLAQHYGLATQLLDWTLNPLVALFFSCISDSNEDGIVFFFMSAFSKNIGDDLDLNRNIAWQTFRPLRIDQRMINQDAGFTYHIDPTKDFGDELGEYISGVVVPKNQKQTILHQLASIGIHNAFIYPGLTTICDKINSSYSGKYTCEQDMRFFSKGAFPNHSSCADERSPYYC